MMFRSLLMLSGSMVALQAALAVSLAEELAAGESQALAFDFTDDFWEADTGHYGSAFVLDTGTPANNYDSHPYGLLTYTSPSAKMTLGPTGELRFGAHNLVLNTADGSQWTAARTNVTTTNGVFDPFGGTSAFTITATGSSARIVQAGIAATVAVTHSCTVWMRRRTGSGTINWEQNQVGVGDEITLTSSWQQFTCSQTSIGGGLWYLGFRIATSGDEIDVYAPHLRRTPSDSTYLATTTAARYALPYEWDSAGNPLGILVEEARTNLCTYSEKFDNAAWSTTEITVAADSTTAPDGTSTADKITPSTGTNYHRINNAAAAAADTTGTLSCYIKPNGYTQVALRENSSTGSAAVFDLTGSGSVVGTHAPGGTTINSATVTALPNGWYRCAFSYTKGGSSTSSLGIYVIDGSWASGDPHSVTYAGDGTSGCYVWGAQHEIGAFPTSYIPTLGSTVTRAADNISLATSAFPYSGTECTLYVRFTNTNSAANASAAILVQDADAGGNRLGHFISGGTNNTLIVSNGGANQAFASAGGSAGGTHKFAGAATANSFNAAVDGTIAGADDTSGSMPTLDSLRLGRQVSAYLNGYIKQVMYLPSRMSNADLQTLTSV